MDRRVTTRTSGSNPGGASEHEEPTREQKRVFLPSGYGILLRCGRTSREMSGPR